ncbi:hypothetical protein Tco_0697009 [Tanacetum coccineum]
MGGNGLQTVLIRTRPGFNMKEEMLSLRGLRANMSSGVSYTEEEIIAMVRKGKKRGHIPGVSRVLTGKGKTAIFIDEPRGTYIDAEIDEIKEEAKLKPRRELDLLRRGSLR